MNKSEAARLRVQRNPPLRHRGQFVAAPTWRIPRDAWIVVAFAAGIVCGALL